MAIKQIEKYGTTSVTPVSNASVRRMQELAGFFNQAASTARAFGEAKATEEAPQRAKEAVDEAIQIDENTNEITFGDLPEAQGYGASATNKIALTLYNNSKEIYLNQELEKYEAEHPNDLSSFTEKSQSLLTELLETGPETSKALLNKEYVTKFKSATKKNPSYY